MWNHKESRGHVEMELLTDEELQLFQKRTEVKRS